MEYDHVASLARSLGFRTTQILHALEEDNRDKMAHQLQQPNCSNNVAQNQDMDQGERLSDFEPDSSDELNSKLE